MQSFAKIVHLCDTSIKALSSLVGSKTYRILTPCLRVAGVHFTAPSFSIVNGQEDYIAITCEWLETPYTGTDYWRMSASEKNVPTGIEVHSDRGLVAPCVINFYEAEPVSSIEIRSSRWDCSYDDIDEHVEYDSALLFYEHDTPRFCFWCALSGPGVATEVHFTEGRDLIGEIVKKSQSRIRL